MNLETQYRLHAVTRWGMVGTLRPQSVAEHSQNVALITRHLCTVLRAPVELRAAAIEWAVVHDLPEVLYGDIPTVTKKHLDTAALNLIDNTLFPAVRPVVKAIVKIADMMEAIKYLTWYAIGPHANSVIHELTTALINAIDKGEHWTSEERDILSKTAASFLEGDMPVETLDTILGSTENGGKRSH